jgi:hypothetical protein
MIIFADRKITAKKHFRAMCFKNQRQNNAEATAQK